MIVLLADVQFATDDGLDAMLVRGIGKMHGAKDIAVVGHGHGGHAEFIHALAELIDVTGAIEQRIVSVQVQVDELGHGSVAVVYRNGDRGKSGKYSFGGGLVRARASRQRLLQQLPSLSDKFGHFEGFHKIGNVIFLQEGASIARFHTVRERVENVLLHSRAILF